MKARAGGRGVTEGLAGTDETLGLFNSKEEALKGSL